MVLSLFFCIPSVSDCSSPALSFPTPGLTRSNVHILSAAEEAVFWCIFFHATPLGFAQTFHFPSANCSVDCCRPLRQSVTQTETTMDQERESRCQSCWHNRVCSFCFPYKGCGCAVWAFISITLVLTAQLTVRYWMGIIGGIVGPGTCDSKYILRGWIGSVFILVCLHAA